MTRRTPHSWSTACSSRRRPAGKPWLRLSLAAYSFRQALDLKKKKATMTLFDFIDFAATLPLEAVELTSYYFAETSDSYLAKLKSHCTRLGLDVNPGRRSRGRGFRGRG